MRTCALIITSIVMSLFNTVGRTCTHVHICTQVSVCLETSTKSCLARSLRGQTTSTVSSGAMRPAVRPSSPRSWPLLMSPISMGSTGTGAAICRHSVRITSRESSVSTGES